MRACSTCSSGVASRSCKTLPRRKNVGGQRPMKTASRSARARASLSDLAAERPQSETAPPIEATPRLCIRVLLKPSFYKNTATFICNPSPGVLAARPEFMTGEKGSLRLAFPA